ncbi:MAG: extracellular solute-binding protein [Acinetobacter sp.]
MKKLVSLLLALTMLMTLVSAASAEGSPVALSVFLESSRPMDAHTEKVHQWAIDNIDVDIQLIQGSADNYKQQLALYITSGDIPDVMVMDYNTYVAYAQEGVFADITDELGKYEALKAYQSAGVTERLKVEDRIYGFAAEDTEGMYSISLRKDWLDKLNLKVPVTMDEMVEVMRAFTTKDPDGNGKADTYGYGGRFLWPFFGAYGVMPGYSTVNDEGIINTHSISEEYRQSLLLLRDLYAEKLIDPEIFTMTGEQQYQKWVQGQMGIFTHWWTHTGNAVTRYAFEELQPNGKAESFMPPTGPEGKSGMPAQDPIAQVIAVSYKATPEKIAAAMRMLNAQADPLTWRIFFYGVEGEYFEVDRDTNKTTWCWAVDGKNKAGESITDTEVYKVLRQPYVQVQSDELSERFGNQLRFQSFQICTGCDLIRNLFLGINTAEYQEMNADVEAYTNEMRIRFILGEASLENDWDAYVVDWLKKGGDKIRQSQLMVYNETNGTDYHFAQ